MARRREAGVGAAQPGRHLRVGHRHAPHVGLVDHRLVQRDVRAGVTLPVEGLVDDHRLRHERGAVALVAGVEVAGRVPVHLAAPNDRTGDRFGVRVDEELVRVAEHTLAGKPRTVDPVAVALTGPDPREEAVVDECGDLRQSIPGLLVVVVEQAHVDPLGALGVHREVRAVLVGRRSERVHVAGPDRHHGFDESGTGSRAGR